MTTIWKIIPGIAFIKAAAINAWILKLTLLTPDNIAMTRPQTILPEIIAMIKAAYIALIFLLKITPILVTQKRFWKQMITLQKRSSTSL